MHRSKVVRIGAHALDEDEKMLIFFGPGITEGLRPYSIIHEVDKPQEIVIRKGEWISFGDQKYQITHVGHLVNQNMQMIQHVCFVFDEVPSDTLSSSVYLTPTKMPEIETGMMITYHE